MTTENVADCLVRNVVSDVGQCSGDPVVAPAWVLASESDYEVLRLRSDWRPTGIRPVLGAIELGGNELAIPAQDRARLGDAGDLGEGFASHSLADFGRVRRSGFDKRRRTGKCARWILFSAARYSFLSSNSWFTRPVT